MIEQVPFVLSLLEHALSLLEALAAKAPTKAQLDAELRKLEAKAVMYETETEQARAKIEADKARNKAILDLVGGLATSAASGTMPSPLQFVGGGLQVAALFGLAGIKRKENVIKKKTAKA